MRKTQLPKAIGLNAALVSMSSIPFNVQWRERRYGTERVAEAGSLFCLGDANQ